MAGRVIRALPLRTFVFTNVGSGKTFSATVAQKLDVSGVREGDLVVRLHSATIPGFPARLTVRVYQDLSTDEDPATIFAGESIAEVSFDSGHSDGSAGVAAMDDARIGSLIALSVEGMQRTQGDTFTASISADLVLKE